MNIEAYNFTVVTTVLGMLVVFVSLTALSLLMVALKASFGERATRKVTARGAAAGSGRAGSGADVGARAQGRQAAEQIPAGGPDADGERQAPAWLTAAVAAYLAATESQGPSAESWLPEFNHYDPWLTPGRPTRTPGVRAQQR